MRLRAEIAVGLVVILIGCGAKVTLPTSPFFSAYSSNALVPFGELQPIVLGQLTKVDANFLYFGDANSYHAEISSFQPTVPGLYFIDEQLYVEGTFSESNIVLRTQLNRNDSMYLYYDNEYTVPIGIPANQSGRVQSLICLNANTDHVEAYAMVTCQSGSTNCGKDVHIRSHLSQFEGFYVSPCNGHN